MRKKWLIIEDSNLCRFPDFVLKNLQIDSYPGAHFRHAQALLEIAKRDQNVQAALRSAKKKFPYSEIWIHLFNFSNNLPEEERENPTSQLPSSFLFCQKDSSAQGQMIFIGQLKQEGLCFTIG